MEYEVINVGDKAEVVHTISTHDISKFVDLTGDDNRLHVDAEFAKKTSFKKQVAHGMLGASFISTVIGTKLPGDGALWYSQNLEFLLPVRIGDTIHVVAEVIKKYDRDQIIELSTNIYNQNKQKVTTGTAKVKVVQLEIASDMNEAIHEETKWALVLGASGGIGYESVISLLDRGFHVVAHYNKNKTRLVELQNNLNGSNELKLIHADLLSLEGRVALKEQILRYTNQLNALVYTPSPAIPNIDFTELQWEDFDTQLKLHVEIPFYLIKSLLNELQLGSAGVVFITTQSIEQPFNKLMPYTTAKGALYGLMKSMATDLSTKQIRVNAVSPSITDTELNADLPAKVKLVTAAKTPLRRLAQPNDVAQAIAFLADSDQSSFITGETIRVNGGQIML
jgi:3-oxoacyl-[acyl-carrier protein] reductase